jgi:predicted acetyltransferase
MTEHTWDMAIEIRAVRDDEHETMVLNDLRAFNATTPTAPVMARLRTGLELDRFLVGVDDGELVSNAGAFSFQLTLPGGATVPAAGVTWVAVLPTHRRRGLMRGMLDRLAADARDRGEVAAILYAAEGGIYENVGYGAATRLCESVINPRRVVFRPDAPSGGTVRFMGPDQAGDVLPAIQDLARRRRAGEVDRHDRFWSSRLTEHTAPPSEKAAPFTLLHFDDEGTADGYAVYTSEERWAVDASHLVTVSDFAAGTDVAHAELWRVLCSLDLVGEIHTEVIATDDPLLYMLRDERAVHIASVSDGLWLKVLDVEGLFGARSYATDDTLVIDSGELGRWSIGASGCKETDNDPDVTMSPVELGAISLGGSSVAAMVRARRIVEHTPGAAVRLDALLASDPLPYPTTHF